jgi:hypothetical protein
MPDYLPSSYPKLRSWVIDFLAYLEKSDVSTRLGLDKTRLENLHTEVDAYLKAFDRAEAHNAGKVDRHNRKLQADELSKFVRHYVNVELRYNENLTDEDRINLGLNVPDYNPSHEPGIEEFPDVEVDSSVIRRIGFRFLNREHHASKPKYVHGIEVVSAIVPPDVTPTIAMLTRSTFYTRASGMIEFDDTQRGQRLALCARYESNTGGKGPFGDIITVFIP